MVCWCTRNLLEVCLCVHLGGAAGGCLSCGVSAKHLSSTSKSLSGALRAAGGAATVPVRRKVPQSLAEVDNGQVRAPRCHRLFQTNVCSSPVHITSYPVLNTLTCAFCTRCWASELTWHLTTRCVVQFPASNCPSIVRLMSAFVWSPCAQVSC